MNMRLLLRGIIPYRLVQAARRLAYYGTAHRCYVCGARLRVLLPQGYGYPILEQLQVVGGMRKEGDRCPVCHSSDRERLVKFFLEQKVFGADEELSRPGVKRRVLHLAPEKGITQYLMSRDDVDYQAGDLDPGRYYHLQKVRKVDLTSLAMEDGACDLLIANHVLEHIPDDARAMAEIRRVLAPGGVAVLQVPFSMKLEVTIEGGGQDSESTRIARYGQADHVRLYTTLDYMQRLVGAGLAVDLFWAFDHDPTAATLLRINPFEPVFVCSTDIERVRSLCRRVGQQSSSSSCGDGRHSELGSAGPLRTGD